MPSSVIFSDVAGFLRVCKPSSGIFLVAGFLYQSINECDYQVAENTALGSSSQVPTSAELTLLRIGTVLRVR